MSNNKRYYWLKLMQTFFHQARIKKMRKIAGGDTYVVIYLKMMLLSINTRGVIEFEGIESTFEEEIALRLDEDVENVKVVITFLIANKLLSQINNTEFELIEVPLIVGSETASTKRSRKSRATKDKLLQCNTSATKCNTEKEKDRDRKR